MLWQCPACGGEAGDQKQVLSAAEAATAFVRPRVDQDRYDDLVESIVELWGCDKARLVQCSNCGLRSADPFVGGDARFYALAYGHESLHPYPTSRWEYGLTAAVVASTMGSVLEIGAGSGAFQRFLLAQGVDRSRLHATEFDDRARRTVSELGISVTKTDFRLLDDAQHSVLCGHQVFEHLGDLDSAFEAFDRLTSPAGFVVVSVPNGTNLLRSEAAGGLVDMPPNHVSAWNFTAFKALADRRGWKLADFREEPISHLRAAKELAKSRTFQARMRPNSFPALVERRSRSPRSRYILMAAAAALKLPSAYLMSSGPFGGSMWVKMTRAST